MVQKHKTLIFVFGIYLALMLLPFESMSHDNELLQSYQGAYEINRLKDLPITGSNAVAYKLDYTFPPKKIIDFYGKIFSSSDFKNFWNLSSTRKWRTYYIDHQGVRYRTKEYLASWWDTKNNYLYSLNLRYTTPAKVIRETTELNVIIQQVPFSEKDYSILLEKINNSGYK